MTLDFRQFRFNFFFFFFFFLLFATLDTVALCQDTSLENPTRVFDKESHSPAALKTASTNRPQACTDDREGQGGTVSLFTIHSHRAIEN